MAVKWTDTLEAVAPGLATAIGGPVAGLAVTAIEKVFGLTPGTGTDETMAVALNTATPDQLLALKKADNDFTVQMKQLDIDLAAIDEKDVDSARNREVQTKDWSNSILGTVIISGFLLAVFFVLSGNVAGLKDPNTAALIGTLIGYVSAKADQVVSYYFGSNRQSQKKDDTINLLSK